MAKRKRVLHVDDSSWELEAVREALAPVAEIELLSFSSLAKAQEAAKSGGIDLFIVDGSINKKGDGFAWAESLREKGHKAYLLSSSVPQNLARFQISKGDFTLDTFMALVLKILGI